jgi:hypothetical protein
MTSNRPARSLQGRIREMKCLFIMALHDYMLAKAHRTKTRVQACRWWLLLVLSPSLALARSEATIRIPRFTFRWLRNMRHVDINQIGQHGWAAV